MSRMATCHPDRPHLARGLCRQCYEATPARREQRRAHNATPAQRERRRFREATPVQREKRRVYEATPAQRERKRAYNAIPVQREKRHNPATYERQAAYVAARAARQRSRAVVFLGGRCVVCETAEDLQFDHIDPTTKSFQISDKLGHLSWDRLLPEVLKCQLLCQWHHVMKTVAERAAERAAMTPVARFAYGQVDWVTRSVNSARAAGHPHPLSLYE